MVQLIYGGGSIKRTGLYDKVLSILKEAGKTVVEDAGVMPNPTVEKLAEGAPGIPTAYKPLSKAEVLEILKASML